MARTAPDGERRRVDLVTRRAWLCGPWKGIAVVVVVLPAVAVLLAAGRQAAAVDDRVVWSSNQAVNGWYVVDVLANDAAPPGAAVELVSGPTDGVVEPTTSPPGFRWRPGGGLTARWTYRITDGAGGYSNTATVDVGARLAPEPRDDAHEATDGILLSVPAPGVLGNDGHPNRDPMVAEGYSPNGFTARGGRYSVAADGAFEYSPPRGFTGDDSFSYLAVDPDGDASEATVHLTVRARPEPSPESPPGGDRPSTDAPEITVHLHGYSAACLEGVIVVGGSALGTWLDDSRAGGDASQPWDFIDLHAIIPAELPAGVHEVAFRCGGETHVAGTMAVPTSEPLTAFELTRPPESPPTATPEPTADVPTEAVHTSDPPPPPPTEGSGAWAPAPSPVLGVPTWHEVSTDVAELATSAALTAWFLILVLLLEAAFPADLVNKVVELVRTPTARRREPFAPRVPGWLRVPGYALAGGALLAWADPQNKSLVDGGTLLKVGAGAAALLLVVLAYETPKDLLLRSVRGPARVRAIGLGFAVAAATATASRLLELPVPYVYGLVIVYIALVVEPRGAHRGRATLGGGAGVLVVCLGLWVAAEPVIQEARHAAGTGTYTLARRVRGARAGHPGSRLRADTGPTAGRARPQAVEQARVVAALRTRALPVRPRGPQHPALARSDPELRAEPSDDRAVHRVGPLPGRRGREPGAAPARAPTRRSERGAMDMTHLVMGRRSARTGLLRNREEPPPMHSARLPRPWHRLGMVPAITVLAASLITATAPPAHALPPPVPVNTPVVMSSVNHGYVWDVGGAGRDDRAEIVAYPFYGFSNQFWRWMPSNAAPGHYMLVAQHSNKCLDVQNGSLLRFAPVWQWTCGDGNNAQLWRVEYIAGTQYQRLINRGSGLCLIVPDVKGRSLYQDACGGDDGEALDFVRPLVNPAPVTDPPTTSVAYLGGGGPATTRFSPHLSVDVTFMYFNNTSSGRASYRIRNEWYGTCLRADSTHAAASATLWSCTQSVPPGTAVPVAALWTMEPAGTDWVGMTEYLLRVYDYAVCLTRDYPGAGRLGVTPCNAGDARQRWRNR